MADRIPLIVNPSANQIQEVPNGDVVTLINNIASSNKTTGALVVTGGVGIGGALNVGGDITAFATSDKNLKENLVTIPNALDKVSELRGVTFNYKKDGKKSTGLIAQELEKVLPEVVYDTHEIANDDEEFKAVRYGNTVGLLVEAIKELKTEVEELKNKIC